MLRLTNRQKLVIFFLVVIVLAVMSWGIVVNFLGSFFDDNYDSPPVGDTSRESRVLEYSVYRDDYIRFKYPKGWITSVWSDDFELGHKCFGYKGELTKYRGTRWLKIGDPHADTEIQIKYLFDCPYKPEPDTIYDLSQPDQITITFQNQEEVIELQGLTEMIYIDTIDRYYLIDHEKQTLLKASAQPQTYYYDNNTARMYLDFMATIVGSKDPPKLDSAIYIKCNHHDFPTCNQFLNTFFHSVKKL